MRPHDVTDEADMDIDDDEPPPSMWEKKVLYPDFHFFYIIVC